MGTHSGRTLSAAALLCLIADSALAFGPPRPISGDFLLPSGVAVDGLRVVVADTAQAQLKFAERTSLEGSPSFVTFGQVTTTFNPVGERLGRPVGLVSNGAGSIFVVDQAGSEVQRFDWDGAAYVHQPAFLSSPGNTAASVRMQMPTDIAIDAMGHLYVLDGANKRVLTSAAPGYASWTVFASDPTWPSCSGMDVTPMGDRVYLACASDDPLLEVPAVGTWAPLGRAGRLDGELYEPQDVAVMSSGSLVVADTGNARIEQLDPSTGAQTHIATAPDLSQPNRLALDGPDLFATDVARNQLIAFLDMSAAPADVFVRDYVGDDGAEPSSTTFALTSPDLIVRSVADVDLAAAERDGLDVLYTSQQPRMNANNYVYLAVRNRGTADALGLLAQMFSAEPGSTLDFPGDWRREDFYRTWDTPMLNEPNHTIPIDRVPAATAAGGASLPGYRVVGPLVWRPSAPEDAMRWDGRAQLIVRLSLAGDMTIPGAGDDAIRNSNNVARRKVIVRREPPALGTQNTLVILARFSGGADAPARDRVTERMVELDQWLNEVSRGQTRLDALVVGPYELSGTSADYQAFGQDPLVELTSEIVQRAYDDNSGVLDGLISSDPADDISRVVVVVNDPAFPADRATTGAWPYEIDGQTRWLSSSVHTVESARSEWAHGYSHQLGMVDLQLYPGITLDPDDRLPVGWDIMARPVSDPLSLLHPLGLSKARVPWLAPTAGIRFVPRPSGSFDSGVVHLAFQSVLQPGETGLIALGLSEGVTDFYDERHFSAIEARSLGLGDVDGALPGSGVLAYRFDLDIEQGSAPVLLSDHTPGTAQVTDAAIPVGVTHTVVGYGADISVLGLHGDSRGGYDVRVQFSPPGLSDVGFEASEYPWESADIWVDSPDDGFQDPAVAAPIEEQARAGVDNFVYARVHNYGDSPAYDVEVRFSFSDPWHTVGGEDQFQPYDAVLLPVIPARSTVNARILWRPASVDDPHRCVRVALKRLINDQNRGNDTAQQNLNIDVSTMMMTSGSVPAGFEPSEMTGQYMNHDSEAKRIYYRVEGTPAGWQAYPYHSSAYVLPGKLELGGLKVIPDINAPLCSRERVRMSAWAKQRDTIERLGGVTLDVALKNEVKWQGWQVWTKPCSKQVMAQIKGKCVAIKVWMGSSRLDVQKVWARFTGPTGSAHFRTMYTDASGAMVATFFAQNGGDWRLRFEAPGDDCHGPAVFEQDVYVKLPISKDQDQDGLPDAQERTGDADGDGIDNVLDPDSDNDQIWDGQEQPGDADNDGLPNVIDADS